MAAAEVKTFHRHWDYELEHRTSGRQQRKIPMDGVSGVLEAGGVQGSIWPFLDLAKWLGIGSSTGQGFGAIFVEPDE